MTLTKPIDIYYYKIKLTNQKGEVINEKILFSIVLVMMVLFGTVNCLAAEQDSYLIYKNNNFDDHNVGDKPSAFVWHPCLSEVIVVDSVFYNEDALRLAAYNNTEIVKVEKDGNADNLAVKFNADKDNDGIAAMARALIQYYPIKESGVVSFSFRVDDLDTNKIIKFNGNVDTSRESNYTDNASLFDFIKIEGTKVYFGGDQLIADNIQPDIWYRVDLAFNFKNKQSQQSASAY